PRFPRFKRRFVPAFGSSIGNYSHIHRESGVKLRRNNSNENSRKEQSPSPWRRIPFLPHMESLTGRDASCHASLEENPTSEMAPKIRCSRPRRTGQNKRRSGVFDA